LRADSLHRLLLSDRGASALTLADIEALPDLASWNHFVLEAAINDLVAAGMLTDDAYGRIHVEPIAEATS